MIRALIADDEALSRRALRQLLERHSDVEIVAECHDGADAREAMVMLKPDVAFLDVRMPLENGLDLARFREDRSRTLIVFVTAFDSFALPAFEVDAADYLTKPLTEARFDEALARVRDRANTRRHAEQTAGGSRGSEPPAPFVSHLIARVGLADIIIPLETIDYIQADDVYAAVMARNKRQLVRTSLDTLERTLDPRLFVRVHRSYIVRIDRVIALHRRVRGGAEVIVSPATALPVSRRRRARVTALFGRL